VLSADSETCTACVSTFCVVSGTLHAVLLSSVLDVDEACYYTSTSRTVGRRQPCYRWSSAYRRRLRRLFLARSHDVQPSESAGHVFLFVNTVRSSHLAAQQSTLAYMEQSPAELHSLDVTGCFTSEH